MAEDTSVKFGVKAGWRAHSVWSEMLAEFVGCFVLLAFGAGCVAVAVVGLTESHRTMVIFQGAGGWMVIVWGWAFAVAMAVYVAGGVSGAHINPAVTLAFALKGNFPWRKVVPYWIAQVAGCFAGAAIVYYDYFRAINAWNLANHVVSRADPGGLTTFSIFATFPAAYYGSHLGLMLLDQIIATFFSGVFFVFAIIDNMNVGPGSNLAPLMIGFAVAAIGLSFGVGTGYAINPARDFGPRLFCWLQGWGPNAFPGPHGYWWVPIVGPLIGAAIAVYFYDWCISKTLCVRAKLLKERQPHIEQHGLGFKLEKLQKALDEVKTQIDGADK